MENKAARWVAMVGIVGFALLIVLTSVDWSTRPAVEAVKTGQAAAIWEFWFNRYQTLIGAAIALLAGGAAFWATLSQFRLSRQDQLRKEFSLAMEHQMRVEKLAGMLSGMLRTDALQNMLFYPDQRSLIDVALREREPTIDEIKKLVFEISRESYQPYSKIVYPQGLGAFNEEVMFAWAALGGFDRRLRAAVAGWNDEDRRPALIKAVFDHGQKCFGFISSIEQAEDEASDGPRGYRGFHKFLNEMSPFVSPKD